VEVEAVVVRVMPLLVLIAPKRLLLGKQLLVLVVLNEIKELKAFTKIFIPVTCVFR
jgi:hypothetical protein